MGFTSLVYEVYSAKVLFLYFVESTHAVAITLSAFLAGLGSSALVSSRFVKEDRPRALTVLVGLQIASAAYAVLVLRHHELVPGVADLAHHAFGTGFASDVCRILFSWVYLFLPGFFIGGAFPILTGLYVDDLDARTRDAGVVYFWDTFGAIVGAMAAGFVLLPWLGLRRAPFIPAGINLLVVSAIVERRVLRAIAVAAALGCFGLAFSHSALQVRQDRRFGRVVAQEQSPFGLVTIADGAMDKPGDRALFIGLRDMCHSARSASETLLGENTVAELAPGARVLNIGLGCGLTAGVLASSPKIAQLEIAEINPVVVRTTRALFGPYNGHVLDLDKTRLFVEDGAELLRETPRVYDAVVVDIEEPVVVHSSVLYTREYFELIRRRLAPRGVLALWMAGMDPACGRIVQNTLRAVFSNVDLRVAAESPTFSFYASMRPLDLPPQSRMDARLAKEMSEANIDELNTIDNRALERHFDVYRAFLLPPEYDEPVFVDATRAKSPGATSKGDSR